MAFAQCDFLQGTKLTLIEKLDDPKSLPDNIVQIEIPDGLNLDTNELDIGVLEIDPDTKVPNPDTIKIQFIGMYAICSAPKEGDTYLQIEGTTSVKWQKDNLVRYTRMGKIQIEVPAYVDGLWQINVSTMQPERIITDTTPDAFTQLMAALVKNNVVSLDDFDSNTAAKLNTLNTVVNSKASIR